MIKALKLDVVTINEKTAPAAAKLLVMDADGDVAHGDFSYSSLVGMIVYLSGHSRPDIAYVVNHAANYRFCQRHSH